MVSVDRLVEVLWGDGPPETAVSSLQTYVSRLRPLLPPSARLETAAPGYRLRLEPGTADVDRFEAALNEALGCLTHRPEAALAGLDEALGLWHGDAFAEFRDEWWAHGEAARLEELRLHAREAHAEAPLTLARDEAAVSEARAVTADHPGRERAWRVLVLGLHRCGRQSEALRAASEYRAHLREDSGLDPSRDFTALEHDILVDAPHLTTTDAVAADDRPALAPTIARLAAAPLVGRGAALTRAERVLDAAAAGGSGTTLIVGEAGIGKSRLAAAVAAVAAARGFTVLYGGCDEGLSAPYQPIVEAFRRWFAQCPDGVLAEGIGPSAPSAVA
jgi:DNA-binding SARP family transcriptional activator